MSVETADVGKIPFTLAREIEKFLRNKLDDMLEYQPKIGFLGKTGVGKSSLCNALFGEDVCPVSDVESCTRDVQELLLDIGAERKIVLLDIPGVGENQDSDQEYAELYASLIPEMDAVLWLVKADDRAYSSDYLFYQRVVKPRLGSDTPFLVVVNQIDKIEPCRGWDEANRVPGTSQVANIRRKMDLVAEGFGITRNQVVAVSANEGYALDTLVERVIRALPDEKKASVATNMDKANINQEAKTDIRESVSKVLEGALWGSELGAKVGACLGTWLGPLGRKAGETAGKIIGGIIGGFVGFFMDIFE